MSFEGNAANLNRSIDDIFAAALDPAMERYYDELRGAARILNETGDHTAEEVNDFVREFDSNWPHYNTYIGLSGAYYVSEDEECVRIVCDDMPVVSLGFCFIDQAVKADDGEIIASYLRPAHYVALLDEHREQAGYAHAFLDEVLIEYSVDSVELSENRLRLHSSELVEDIDVAVLNSASEAEAALSLRDLVVIGDPNDSEFRNKVIDLQQYIDSLIDFDQEVPYIINASGTLAVRSLNGGLEFTADDGAVYAYVRPESIKLLHSTNQPENDLELLIPYVHCTVFGPTRKLNDEVWIPIRTIESFKSLRG